MKITKKTYIVIDYSDLETKIHETYRIGKTVGKYHTQWHYSILGHNEFANDSSYDYEVDGTIYDYEKIYLKDWIKHRGNNSLIKNVPSLNTILNDMANKRIIEKGNYLVQVCY